MTFALSALPLSKDSSWPAAGLVVAAITLAALKILRNHRRLPTPPGPKGLPIIGNTLQLPTEDPHLVYAEWSREHGDLVYFEALGMKFLVINSLSSINELLAKRATNYSHRLFSPILALANTKWLLPSLNYGPSWREGRQIFHRFFNQTQVHRLHPVIEQEIPALLRDLMDRPAEFREALHLFFGTVIMRVSYGASDSTYNKNLIEEADATFKEMQAVFQPGHMLVGLFPPLRHVPSWFPGAGWKRRLERLSVRVENMRTKPFADTRNRMRTGASTGETVNMATELIEGLPGNEDPLYNSREEVSRDMVATAYLTGADTTLSSALALFLALAGNTDAQVKAQAQIDEVVGTDRLPTFNDLDRLPYVQAIVKEVGRWHSVVPMALPHVSEKEDTFNGYRIPAGTVIFSNTWSIMHDPNVFEDPMKFKPERYLKDGQIDPSVLDPEVAAFGYGRRICPGRHFSSDSLLLMTACLITCFDIRPSVDNDGRPVPLILRGTSTVISTPLPFECQITPRSKHHAKLVESLLE